MIQTVLSFSEVFTFSVPSKVIIIVIELMFLGMNMFWALILRARFNPHLAAKMSSSKVQNIFIPLEHKLYCFIIIFMCCYSPCSVDGEGVSVFI